MIWLFAGAVNTEKKIFRQCGKACDTSIYLRDCNSSCIAYRQRIFLQCAWACDSWDDQRNCKNSCTSHTWNDFLLRFWGVLLLHCEQLKGFAPEWVSMCLLRFPAEVQAHLHCVQLTAFLMNAGCESWGDKLLCRRSNTVCNTAVMGFPEILDFTM